MVKRDIFSASIKPNLLIHWNSDLETHIGEHVQQNWNAMVDDIVSDPNPGSLQSTLRYNNKLNLQKRGGEFDVQWVSYNWDDPNSDLAKCAAQDKQLFMLHCLHK